MRNKNNAKLSESTGSAAADCFTNNKGLSIEHERILSKRRLDRDRERFLRFVVESIIPHAEINILGNGITEIWVTGRRYNTKEAREFLSSLMKATESGSFQLLTYQQPE